MTKELLMRVASELKNDEKLGFRITLNTPYWEKQKYIKLKYNGYVLCGNGDTLIDLVFDDSEIESKTPLPQLFLIEGRVKVLTRIVYKDGRIEYKEEDVSQRYQNQWPDGIGRFV